MRSGEPHRRLKALRGWRALIFLLPVLALAETDPPQPAQLKDLRGVAQAEFNQDASRILIRLRTGEVGLWDVATGMAISAAFGSEKATCCVMSADRKRVVIGFAETSRVFDSTAGSALSPAFAVPLNEHLPTPAVFSPDGELLVVLRQKEASIWRVKAGEKIKTIPLPAGPHEDAPPEAIFTEAGAHCFLMDPDGTVTRYDTQSWGRAGKPMRHRRREFAYEFGFTASEDGRWIATWDDAGENGPKTGLQVWDARAGKALGSLLTGINGFVGYFLPGQNRILIKAARGEGQVRDLPSMKLRYKIRTFDDLSGAPVAFSPEGKWILSWDSRDTLDAIDAESGTIRATTAGSGSISQVLFGPDSSAAYVFRDNPDNAQEQY
ncbi:MAG TPA: WD40 repeat domain-containing protein, partial [Chthoniobacterales bacterium]|nr:WD40 repeat domain-containing protein [Chthoniobacterales bacterium]